MICFLGEIFWWRSKEHWQISNLRHSLRLSSHKVYIYIQFLRSPAISPITPKNTKCELFLRTGEAGNFAVVMSKLTRHLPAVLRFLRHGLQRRAGPGDAGLRGHAMRAVRALHRAGLGGDFGPTVTGGSGWGKSLRCVSPHILWS